MKIGFVIDDSLDKPDGVQQYVLMLGRWFTRQGHEVHYLCGQTERKDLSNVHSLSQNTLVRFNGNRMSIPKPASKQKINKLLSNYNFDVLHVQMPHHPLMAARIVSGASPSTAVVGTFHIAPYSSLATNATKLLGLWLKKNLQHFSAFISVSQPAADFAEKTFRISSMVIPNPINLKEYKPSKDQRPNTMIFLGRLVKRKGCFELLKAYRLLKEKPVLIIAGDGPDRKMLESYSRRNNFSRVKFVGRVMEADKQKYFSEAAIAVFPSLGGESFGIVLLEAMASGAGVVLAGNNAGYKSVMGDISEVIFDPQNPKSFAKTIERFLDDKQLAEAVHNLQQKRVKDFDIDIVAPKILEIYKQAIAKKTH
jgi:phosphatidylinositol alpha-mannosyltransferase